MRGPRLEEREQVAIAGLHQSGKISALRHRHALCLEFSELVGLLPGNRRDEREGEECA